MTDGVDYVGETMVAAPGITAAGTKRVLDSGRGRRIIRRSAQPCWRS